ncbi:hypothetical protein SAMN05444321_0043 [Bradyrhizobium lablabi]|nr:hypothetical protein SAMN05444321_0043 [Bradyrhizobium lablabi]
MLLSAMRLGITTLCALLLAGSFLPNAVLARGGLYSTTRYSYGLFRPAYGPVAIGIGYKYYGYPLDDSFDYPRGYGEYAEYGPWASQGYSGGCQLTWRRVRTHYRLSWRAVRFCY